MATHLDFKCVECGAVATLLGTIAGTLVCAEHQRVIHPHMVDLTGFDRDLWDHTLEVIMESQRVQLYRLVDPDCRGSEMQSTRIGFLDGYVVIHGDMCPGVEQQDNRGVTCGPNYDRPWFVGAKSPDYLNGKFLERVFVPELAADMCRERIDTGLARARHDEELEDLATEADALDMSDGRAIEAWKARLYEVTGDWEDLDACMGYEPANAALLGAIQRRFRLLWLRREGAFGDERAA